MEVAGLIVGSVVLIKPLTAAIHDTLSNYRSFGQDAERLRLRFAVQQTRLESFEHVLFDKDKFLPAMPGRLIDHLTTKICNDFLSLLRQLYELLFEFSAVRAQYKVQGGDDLGHFDGDLTEERMSALVLSGKSLDASQQKSVGWARKMMWVAFQRSSTEKLVSEFEAWTERTRLLLEAALWPLSFFSTLERMRNLETDKDARNAGLLQGISLRKLLVSPPDQIPGKSQATEVSALSIEPIREVGKLKLCLRKEDGKKYLVEYKHYQRKHGASGGPDSIVQQRVVQLAALLHDAPISDAGLSVFQCKYYFDDIKNSRFGLVFDPPKSDNQPMPLAALLDAGGKDFVRASLSDRMRLAHKIALCLQRLHAYSWVHKSLRTENIYLVATEMTATTNNANDPSSQSQVTQASAPLGQDYRFENLRIAGFEYSRQQSDFSDQFGETEIKRNIYRHPSRWGQPTQRFEKVHDIYALGVILLELGLWTRADHLDNGALLTPAMANDPLSVQKKLLKHATVRLGFFAGSRFQDIVIGCLSGTVGEDGVEAAFTTIVKDLETMANGLVKS